MQSKHPLGARLVDRIVLHGETDFRSVCRQVLTPETRYIVFDLDRTIHQGRNVGERLGWEMTALEGYGRAYLDTARKRTDGSRFYVKRGDVLGFLRYWRAGLSRWALPGLFYFLSVKVAHNYRPSRRLLYALFGRDPVDAVQSVQRLVLLHQMAAIPEADVRVLARELWRRLAPFQVILPEDIAWIRTFYPQAKLILSSASPQPVLDAARESLGFDAAFCTEIESVDGYYSAPIEMPFGIGARIPRRIAAGYWDNASERKVERMLAAFPDLGQAETVGFSDASHGEDHTWAEHFHKVVDVNSPTPYAPIVSGRSPLREVHSAVLLPGGAPKHAGLSFDRAGLEQLLAREAHLADAVTSRYQTLQTTVEEAGRELRERLAAIGRDLEQAVAEYNASVGRARKAAFKKIRKTVNARHAVQKLQRKLEAPLARAAYERETLLRLARGRVRPLKA
jgi:phosphoserine phosphatase